jgi:hypothetical protein
MEYLKKVKNIKIYAFAAGIAFLLGGGYINSH